MFYRLLIAGMLLMFIVGCGEQVPTVTSPPPTATSTPTPVPTATPIPPTPTPTPEAGRWEIATSVDRLSGDQTTSALLPAVWSDVEFPYETADITLVLRCSVVVKAFIWWGGQYMAGGLSGDKFKASYAVDGGDVHETEWNESNQNEATFVPGWYVDRFLDHIRQGERLVVRVVDFSGVQHTAEFDLTGFDWALAQLPCE